MTFCRLRIRPITPRTSRCRVCDRITDCTAYDHDLRGEICGEDEQFVAIAEVVLRNAHLAIPTDSILEEGGAL